MVACKLVGVRWYVLPRESERERENWNVVRSRDWNLYCFRLKLLSVCSERLDVLIRCTFLLSKFSELLGLLARLFNLVRHLLFGFNGDCSVHNSCINSSGPRLHRPGVSLSSWHSKILYNRVSKTFSRHDFSPDSPKFDDNKALPEDPSNVRRWGRGNYLVPCFAN